jgi:hypothetical protein
MKAGERTRRGGSWSNPAAEVIEAQKQLHEAFFKSDIKTIKRLIVSSGYVHTDVWGRVFDRNGWLEWMSQKGPMKKGSSYKVTDVKVEVADSVAVLTCLWTIKEVNGRTLRGRLTNVWVRRLGQWRRLAYQATPIGIWPRDM